MAADDNTSDDPEPDRRSPPPKPATSFLWKNLFSEQSVIPTPSSSPKKFLPDGTPVVLAPSSVLLKASEAWTGHILCHFLGQPPSPAKIFADLNPVWGRKGAITVRRFSEGTCLIFVPSASHRRWILDAGLWSSGNVSFTVSEWSATSSLTPSKLTSAPTVVTLRDVPPQLWSQRGIETIAGGVAQLIPNARASLPLSSLGTAKIRVIIPLGLPLPQAVVVEDSHGDTVRIPVEYGRLPVLCPSCNSFGHSKLRCPTRRLKESDQTTTKDITIPQSSMKPRESLPEVSLNPPPPPPPTLSSQIDTNSSVQTEDGGGERFDQNPKNFDGPQKPSSCSVNSMVQDLASETPSQTGLLVQQMGPEELPSSDPLTSHPPSHEPETILPPHQPHQPRSPTPQPPLTSNDEPNLPDDTVFAGPDIDPPTAEQTTNSKISSTASSLTSQIHAAVTAAFATPKAPTINSHIYFSTPSTTSPPPITLDSPPSTANHINPAYSTVCSKKMTYEKKKKHPITIPLDEDISRLLDSPEWQRGYRPSFIDDASGTEEKT